MDCPWTAMDSMDGYGLCGLHGQLWTLWTPWTPWTAVDSVDSMESIDSYGLRGWLWIHGQSIDNMLQLLYQAEFMGTCPWTIHGVHGLLVRSRLVGAWTFAFADVNDPTISKAMLKALQEDGPLASMSKGGCVCLWWCTVPLNGSLAESHATVLLCRSGRRANGEWAIHNGKMSDRKSNVSPRHAVSAKHVSMRWWYRQD